MRVQRWHWTVEQKLNARVSFYNLSLRGKHPTRSGAGSETREGEEEYITLARAPVTKNSFVWYMCLYFLNTRNFGPQAFYASIEDCTINQWGKMIYAINSISLENQKNYDFDVSSAISLVRSYSILGDWERGFGPFRCWLPVPPHHVVARCEIDIMWWRYHVIMTDLRL